MGQDSSDVLLREERGTGVLLLTLNRPAQRNAIDLALLQALDDALHAFEHDDRWRVAIVTGASPAFCAGLDLKTFSAPDAPRHRVTTLIHRFAKLTKPIIAAVNGAAYTGGLEMALSCDFILAATSAHFADTHLKIGALSGSGMGSQLPHAVGTRFAKQMMLCGEPVDADTALRVGLVNEVLAPEGLLPRAIKLAQSIADRNLGLTCIVKGVLDKGSRTTLENAAIIEAEALAHRKAQGPMDWAID